MWLETYSNFTGQLVLIDLGWSGWAWTKVRRYFFQVITKLLASYTPRTVVHPREKSLTEFSFHWRILNPSQLHLLCQRMPSQLVRTMLKIKNILSIPCVPPMGASLYSSAKNICVFWLNCAHFILISWGLACLLKAETIGSRDFRTSGWHYVLLGNWVRLRDW